MIVNIRGTSGSGKSTIVRRIMGRYRTRDPIHEAGRRRPIGYICRRPLGDLRPHLFVVGHYEGDCGGCDTISGLDRTYEIIRTRHKQGFDVLFEGLLISAEVRRTAELSEETEHQVLVVALDLPLEECLAAVAQRRSAKAQRLGRPEPEPLDPKNTRSKWVGTRGTVRRLRALNVAVVEADRERAEAEVRMALEAP